MSLTLRIAAVLLTLLGAITVPVASAAPPAVLPMVVSNDSGRSEAVHLYLTGVNTQTGRLGYVTAAGVFTPWPSGSIPPSPAPDVAIPGPGPGAATTLRVPLHFSGRMYMSFGAKLRFFLTPTGLVEPAPWAPGDPNRDILFDWSEFTYNGSGLWLNSSQVDMFSVPHAVEVTASNGQVRRTGTLVADGRARIFGALQGEWARLVHRRSDGFPLRAIAPRKGIELGLFPASYFAPYVDSVWSEGRTLVVAPFQHNPAVRFTGRVSGGVLHFTDGSGARVASFGRPPSKDVFGCDGVLHAPNDQVVGPIARSLCADLNRSTLGHHPTSPVWTAADYYTRAITNHYSKAMHANMVDGRAYGFAFDDVGGHESLVHAPDPRSARIALTRF
ncbi:MULTISPECIES: beta-1,3-glucanase family protein [Actinokineospora]|uniref:Sugar hydrolase n=1 Tax=Actinokineospora fastidiosa TaxID=1816 RepID=A0A918GB20_9PSEU|nr:MULTISPECIES: beta-1,3-glucanase family protein [Actinokineospora]UVS81632.1 Glucan endo-1,3-beta-glucosidase precursor [Actinokineospora sp. UTMC 2448]GGS26320.1 sugar hydrolase [Actinokineospora fastidiosa]